MKVKAFSASVSVFETAFRPGNSSRRSNRLARLLTATAIATATAALAGSESSRAQTERSTAPAPPLAGPNAKPNGDPNPASAPNGFDDLVKAAGMIKNLDSQTQPYPKMSMERLRLQTEPNRDALALARRGLERGCAIPTRMVAVNPSHRAEVMRSLSRLFSAEGAYAEKRERFEEAADSYINLIRLGTEMPKGGLLSDHTAGHNAMRLGRSGVLRVSTHLNSAQLRRVAERLEEIDRGREPISRSVELDAKLNPPKASLGTKVLRAIGPSAARSVAEAQASRQEYKFACLREIARHRILTAQLAIRAYQVERKTPPRELQQLVPDFLRQVPQDPFREPAAPLAYRAGAAGFQIYSVGADRRDDHGAAALEKGGHLANGDILLVPPPAFAER